MLTLKNKKVISLDLEDEILDNLDYMLKKDLILICQNNNITYYKSWSNDKLKESIKAFFGDIIKDTLKYSEPLNGKINILDLCSGCGGIAKGFHNTTLFHHMCLIDIDYDSCESLKLNGFENVNNKDIEEVDFSIFKNKVDLIIIGSPCQSFSYAGKGEGFKDKRGNLLLKFLDILELINPKYFLIENVKGLTTHDNGNSLKLLLKLLKELNYFVVEKVMDSSLYGIPQKRQRLFIFGYKNNEIFEFPKPTNEKTSLYDAIGYLENNSDNEITEKYNEKKLNLFSKIPQGGCWTSLSLEEQKDYLGKSFESGGGKRGILRRLNYEEPCLTILCSPQQKQTERCHPIQDRPLTIKESLVIQTFPDDYKLFGSNTSKYKQVGNAVPVKLAEILATNIADFINKKPT